MQLRTIFSYAALLLLMSCQMSNPKATSDAKTMSELKTLDSLLRDSHFVVKIARDQEAAYTAETDTTATSPSKNREFALTIREEKIAINLAGFYATECGVGAITQLTGQPPIAVLKQIVEQRLDASHLLLLNRFANATWKASQPFRDFKRLRKSNFIVANFLSKEEIKKDQDQVLAAATLLLTKLQTLPTNASSKQQFEAIEQLMKDEAFATEMAEHMEAAYYKGQNKEVPPFTQAGDDTTKVKKRRAEQELAKNLAGFYALECSLAYFSKTTGQPPSAILNLLLKNRLLKQDKELIERFANATWKAGQRFRGIDRIKRPIFKPFDLLPAEEIQKDWNQIKRAAKLVNEELVKE